jgi:2,3-bisphosphoglycerate-independent phosphoglycerate mutase
MGLRLGPADWAVRCNLVTVEGGRMRDFTAGHINNADGARLMATVHEQLGGPVPGARLEFHAGVQYRNVLIYRPSGQAAPFTAETKTQPPHDIPDRPVADYLPKGPGAELLIDLMERSKPLFAGHPVNKERIARGEKPATQVWLWGQGRAPSVPSFAREYGPRGAIVSAVDLVRGTGMLIGWHRLDAPGATGYLDTDYASKGRTGIEALKAHDLVCVHVEAPDEASHEGRADEKVKALERIDEHIVGPLLEELPKHGEWRILVSPDHRTELRTRAHAYGAVPFVVAGTGIPAKGQGGYDEAVAAASDLEFDPGWQLMRWFLGR